MAVDEQSPDQGEQGQNKDQIWKASVCKVQGLDLEGQGGCR